MSSPDLVVEHHHHRPSALSRWFRGSLDRVDSLPTRRHVWHERLAAACWAILKSINSPNQCSALWAVAGFTARSRSRFRRPTLRPRGGRRQLVRRVRPWRSRIPDARGPGFRVLAAPCRLGHCLFVGRWL